MDCNHLPYRKADKLSVEIARSAAQDPSQVTLPTAMHDLKLAWSFMQIGFVASPFQRNFPNLPTGPPDDLLPATTDPHSNPYGRNLQDVLDDTLNKLSSSSGPMLPASQRTDDQASPSQWDQSIESTLAESSMAYESPTKALSMSAASSPDVMDMKQRIEEPVVVRHVEDEPWVWANTLLEQCEELVKHAVVSKEHAISTPLIARDPGGGSLYAERSGALVSSRLIVEHIR